MSKKKFTDQQIAEHLIQHIRNGWTIAEASKVIGLSYATYARHHYSVLNDANDLYGSLSSWTTLSIVDAKKDPEKVIDMLKRYIDSYDAEPTPKTEDAGQIVWDEMKSEPDRGWLTSAFFVLTGFLAGIAFASAASVI